MAAQPVTPRKEEEPVESDQDLTAWLLNDEMDRHILTYGLYLFKPGSDIALIKLGQF